MDNPTIREVYLLLIEFKKQFDNHLRHHFAVTIIALAAGLAGLCNIRVALLILLYK